MKFNPKIMKKGLDLMFLE